MSDDVALSDEFTPMTSVCRLGEDTVRNVQYENVQ